MSVDVGSVRSKLGRLREKYEENLASYMAGLDGTTKDRVLEAHTRGWLLDQLFRELGWIPESIIPEYPVESPPGSAANRWFLDYLGREIGKDGTSVPLLVIEAKRLSEAGPSPSSSDGPQAVWSPAELLAMALRKKVTLKGKWPEWLDTAKEYVVRLHRDRTRYPQRYVMTNGEWFVIFTDPKAAFVDASATSSSILVYESWSAFCGGLEQALPHLQRRHLLTKTEVQEVESGQLATALEWEGGLCRWMFAVDILYRGDSAVLRAGPVPDFKVWPVILVKCASGSWLSVQASAEDGPLRLPSSSSDHGEHMRRHLEDTRAEAAQARTMAERSGGIGQWPEPSSLEDHLRDHEGLSCVPLSAILPHKSGVTHLRVLTGTSVHFIRAPSHRASTCEFHRVERCPDDRRGPHPYERSLASNTFFKSSEIEACLHLTSREAKGPQPTAERDKARCHLWPVEKGLCCQACTLEPVCFARKSFAAAMPCPEPPPVEQTGQDPAGTLAGATED